MRGHRYVGWRRVAGWTCIRCGSCCRRFVVTLTPGEAMYYTVKYGPVVLRYGREFYLAKKQDGSCVFLRTVEGKAYCLVYGDRPRVCRMYPFYVTQKPLSGKGSDAEIIHGGRKLYLYVDALCPGVDTASNIEYLAKRVLEAWSRLYGR